MPLSRTRHSHSFGASLSGIQRRIRGHDRYQVCALLKRVHSMTQQTLTRLPQTRESTHACAAASAPTRTGPLGLLGLAFRRGLLYAGIQQQMENPGPLDAEETWKFWTVPPNLVLDFCAKRWP